MTAARDWIGKIGDVWARECPRTERSFADLEPLLRRAILSVAPDRGQLLDLGCGVGTTSAAIAAARPDVRVTGIDLSAVMVAIARERYDAPNLRFVDGDVLDMAAGQPPDLIFSRHGVMFFADPVSAFTRLRRRVSAGAPALLFLLSRAQPQSMGDRTRRRHRSAFR